MNQAARVFVGHWRITEMEEWDADYFDMEAPAHITIRKDLTGEFQFGLVRGELDGRVASVEGLPRFEFSCQYTRPRSSNRTPEAMAGAPALILGVQLLFIHGRNLRAIPDVAVMRALDAIR